MTTVPEVILCNQMNIPYASMCFNVNPAEGLSKDVKVSHEQTNAAMKDGEQLVEAVFKELIEQYIG